MHLNQDQAAAAAGYEQVGYDQSGLTHEQMAVAAAHAAYGGGQPAGSSTSHRSVITALHTALCFKSLALCSLERN